MNGPFKIAASAHLPTRYGRFRIVAFEGAADGKEHVAIVRGDVAGRTRVPVRIHSECLTGDAFGSLRCDCREQLEAALQALGRLEHGVILYLRQEGRGIGLANKIRAYALQDAGLDTVEANEALGFRPDERDYAVAAQMLAAVDVGSIELMSNNPHKLRALRAHGVLVEGRIPIVVPSNPHNRSYLETKRAKAGHLLANPGLPAAGWLLDVVPWNDGTVPARATTSVRLRRDRSGLL
ncbi:MAG TPA: GTP cyclohydrolase II [Candidatus Thermoplasmatota archaeon]|nr:GTP cyclohydrolase II [Candidatus Thermoplasmatota archaeon]